MERSPAGREIEKIEGNPADIIARGEQMHLLGTRMYASADLLESIKNGAVGGEDQKGKAITALKESIGDSAGTLREAADIYEPVGPIIQGYGEALEGVKPTINDTVDDCLEKWAYYLSLPGDAEGNLTPEAGGGVLGIGGYDADSPEARKEASENSAKKDAYDEWVKSAKAFDAGYDTWWTAFDDAATGVSDELSGSIKDSRWDDWSDFVSVVGTVLSWAALVVGVIAIFFGGFLVLAAILAVAAFVVVAIQFANGAKTGTDLAFAALAIIPVGKITNLTKLAQFPKLAQGLGGASNAISRTWKALSKGPINTIVTRGGDDTLRVLERSKIRENLIGPTLQTVKTGNIKMYIGNRALLESNLEFVRNISKFEFVAGKFTSALGHLGRVQTVLTNLGVDVPKIPPVLRVF